MDKDQIKAVVEETLRADQKDIYHFDLWATAILAILILAAGFLILNQVLGSKGKPDMEPKSNVLNVWGDKLGDHTLQIVGLTFIIPTILMVAVATKLNSDAVTALLGSIIGYLFGSSRSVENKPTPPAPLPKASEPEAEPNPSPAPSPAPSEPKAETNHPPTPTHN